MTSLEPAAASMPAGPDYVGQHAVGSVQRFVTAHHIVSVQSFIRFLCLLVALTFSSTLLHSEDSPAKNSDLPVVAEQLPSPPVIDDDRAGERQRKAMAGLLALCGILIGGLMFVVIVMIWGARLRRLARRELPAQKTLEKDLWFLKPPKPPPSE